MERGVEKADFGEGPKEIVFNERPGDKAAHFAASVEFFAVKCGGKEFKVVGKVQPTNEYARAMMNSDIQFATEVLMYKEILPFFGLQNLFPVLYYGEAEGNADRDVILLEDMSADGYKVTKEKLFLTIQHLRLAIKSLARFHAASFNAKVNKRSEFERLISKMRFKKFSDDEDTSIEHCMARGCNPHMGTYGHLLRPALAAMQEKDFFDTITEPREPWAVVCHGDFCRNNMLFKYDGEEPVAVKFFDMQTSRYTSPAVDLSFFLYLNTDKTTRDLYWDSLLREYLDCVKSHLDSNVTIDEKGFYDDFATRAVYGYYHCSFFTPMMASDEELILGDYGQKSLEERIEIMVNMAGDKGTQLIADIVAHMLEKGYIQKFVDFVDSIKNKK